MKRVVLVKRPLRVSREEFELLGPDAGAEEPDTYHERAVRNHVAGTGPRNEPFPFDAVDEFWLKPSASAGELQFLPTGLDRSASRQFMAREVTIKEGRAAVKLTILSRRRKDLDAEKYLAYWKDVHGSLVRSQKGFDSLLRGYVQNHIIPGSFSAVEGSLPEVEVPFSGMMQMWFDSDDDMRQAFSSKDYVGVIRNDEPNFIAVGHSIAFIAHEPLTNS